MAKLQQITRSNGSLVHSVNIPIEIIETVGWIKGEDLNIFTQESKNGELIIIISKE